MTALLIWRGIFVGRYLGLLGLPATVIALRQMPPRQRDPLALLAFVGFAIAVMHGALSVSIPRYNLALIPVYAISLAWLIGALGARLLGEYKQPRAPVGEEHRDQCPGGKRQQRPLAPEPAARH